MSNDISNKEGKYLLSSYLIKKSGPRKDHKFYKEISHFWKTNKECCIEIIDTLPKIGYYKDFFYILEYCDDNIDLRDYMYEKIIKLMKRWKYGKNIMLSKWIPRENSSFDRKYDFVNKISEKLFPEETPNIRKKKYRLLVSSTCHKINTFESNLCMKSYDKILDVTENNLKTYQKAIMRNKQLRNRVSEILKSRYENFSLKKLLKEREKKNLRSLRRVLLEPYIKNKVKYLKEQESTLIIVNLDCNLISNHLGYIVEKLKVYSKNHIEFVINGEIPKIIKFEGDIERLLRENMDSCDNLDIKSIVKITGDKYNEYIVFSTHELEYEKEYKDYSISWRLCKEKKFKERDVYGLEDILKKYQKKSWIEKAIEWWNYVFG